MYCTMEVWPHSSAWRSMLAGFYGEGQTRYINDKSSKWFSLTSLVGVLGDYAEMKEMIL